MEKSSPNIPPRTPITPVLPTGAVDAIRPKVLPNLGSENISKPSNLDKMMTFPAQNKINASTETAKKPEKKAGWSLFGPKLTPEAIAKKKEEERQKREQEKREKEAQKTYEKGLTSVMDLISPASVQIAPTHLMLNDLYVRTLFVFNYPRYLFPNWLSPMINMDVMMDMGIFVYPLESRGVLEGLRKRSGQVESALGIEAQKGLVRNPELETALGDIEELRDRISRGEEKLFHFCLYFTIYAKTLDDLDLTTRNIETQLGGILVYTKRATFQTSQGFKSTIPLATDLLDIRRNMNTGALSTVFPFTSMSLTRDEGIMYGINRHNRSLIIFDRFSLENMNSVVFAKAGGGKSYAVKLEALRYMMFGVDIIVIDPEDEYQNLCRIVGGSYLNISLGSDKRINPFDISPLPDDATEEQGEDTLRTAIITIKGLLNLMLGKLSMEEDALTDRAIAQSYTDKGITKNPATQKNASPLMADLLGIFRKTTGAESLAIRLDKYVTGTFAGIFNKPTNINLDTGFVVFNIRDMETALRPVAMYMVLNYIWAKIRAEKRKRILIVDEAWIMMENEDAAKFLFAIAKRARKYLLGLTTITQDIEDFLRSPYGKAIVTNSSLQLLLKQSPASIEVVGETFHLTEGEKSLLLEARVGEGLFFAGLNHVAIKVQASYAEAQVVSTSQKKTSDIEQAKV